MESLFHAAPRHGNLQLTDNSWRTVADLDRWVQEGRYQNEHIEELGRFVQLGPGLSQTLQNIYANRSAASSQFYLSLVEGVSNPSFDHELKLRAPKDPGCRLSASRPVFLRPPYTK